MRSSHGKNTLIFAAVALGTVALDQVSKALAASFLEPGGSVRVIPGVLCFTYTTNTGAAFGLLKGNSQLIFLAALLLTVLLMAWFFLVGESLGAWTFVGLALITGGAVGNLADRLFRGNVVDFLDLGWWPVFNVADAAIVAGVIIVLLSYGRELFRSKP